MLRVFSNLIGFCRNFIKKIFCLEAEDSAKSVDIFNNRRENLDKIAQSQQTLITSSQFFEKMSSGIMSRMRKSLKGEVNVKNLEKAS